MISKQNIIMSFTLLALFAMLLLSIFGDKGLADMNMMEKVLNGLIDKNDAIARENLSLYRTIDRLKHDPKFIESVARQELGVIADNELILKIENKQDTEKKE